MQARAAELRQAIDAQYERYGDAASPDTVLRFRHYDSTDYLFVLNDKRTFGNYVGQHGKVMEQGLPHTDELQVRRGGGFVYDLVQHKPVPAATQDGMLKFAVELGPGDGRVFMITERPIAEVQVAAPARARRGERVSLHVRIVDEAGESLRAVIPLQVEILDPQGRAAEFSGYYGARDGELRIDCDLAPNDLAGNWKIRVRELASQRTHEQTLVVEPSP